MPEDVIDVIYVFGFALLLAQTGKKYDQAKPLKGFGGASVLEVVEDYMDLIRECLKAAQAHARGA